MKFGLFIFVLCLAGCHKRPASFEWIGCKVVNTWTDEHEVQRKDCLCKNGQDVGIDANTRMRIIRCE